MPINSVDVQPRGYRILTGGNDNKVCIWNLLPIASRKYEMKGIDQTQNQSNPALDPNKKTAKSEIEVEIDS